MDGLTIGIYATLIGLGAALFYIIWSYIKGMRECPKELWQIFAAKIIEYTAYGAINMTFVLFLSKECGLSDMSAGSYLGFWSLGLSLIAFVIGAFVDAIGIKKTLVIGTSVLLVSRVSMAFTTNIYAVTFLGFIPTAIGFAIMGPCISVGIKKYTTKEESALGFALFYTLMNVGFALGGWLFDFIRANFGGETGEYTKSALTILSFDFSTYQLIFLVGLILTIPSFLLILLMRDGVERTDDGVNHVAPPAEKAEGTFLVALSKTVNKAIKDTIEILKSVIMEKSFWIFMGMLGTLIGVRFIFYHFHYTFPKYGIRVLGEGAKIGSIYGVLNPLIIVFLVPFIAHYTKKVKSYNLMMVGTFISAFSVFIATMPEAIFSPLVNTWVGELIFVRWLDIAPSMSALALNPPNPTYLPLIVFIVVFTVGEAFWSPRLMQFTVEIAPKGKEGSYMALSILPFFVAKMFVGPLSGWLISNYTPEGGDISNHYMVWIWIGSMALITPISLVVFRKLFLSNQEQGENEEVDEIVREEVEEIVREEVNGESEVSKDDSDLVGAESSNS